MEVVVIKKGFTSVAFEASFTLAKGKKKFCS